MQNIKNEEDFEESSDNPNKEWEVEKILKDRTKRRKNKETGKMEQIKEYLIKWVGFKTPTWEPEENLENSQELLKDFLLKQIIKKCKKVKTKKKAINTINTSKIYKYEISPNVSEYQIKSNGIKEEEEQSTFTNSINNQESSNKIKTNKNTGSSLPSLAEEEENAFYDIEIDGDEKKEGNDLKKEQESLKAKKGLESKYLKIVKNEEITVKNKKENDNMAKIAKDDTQNHKINNINRIIPEKEDLIDSEKKSYSIYLEEDKDESENLDKIIKDKSETESSKRFLAKKRKKDIFINCDRKVKKDNSIKVIEIYSMKVPGDDDKDGKGIKLNIKFQKNNKIYIEEFYSKSGEISSDYLAKYFEMFICDSFKGEKYSKGMSFD